jgi:hypothetical protein
MKRGFLKIFSLFVLVVLSSTSVFGQQSQAPAASTPVVSKQIESDRSQGERPEYRGGAETVRTEPVGAGSDDL